MAAGQATASSAATSSNQFNQAPSAARRGVLLGALMSLAVPKAAPAAPATRERIGSAATALTAALSELHGGEWSVTVDHEHRFVLILESFDGGAK